MTQLPVTEADLHAYVDGFLSDARRGEIDAYLAARPEELERIAAYRAQNQALRALYTPVLDEPVPLRIASVLVHRRERYGRLVAGLLIALAGGAGGWMLHGAAQRQPTLASITAPAMDEPVAAGATHGSTLAQQAAYAHLVYSPDARRPVEIGADQEEQLVKWLTKRTGADMRPPKLGKLGYELIGGRLLPGDGGTPVAQFMYQDAGGQRLTLYVSTDQAGNTDTGFRFAQQGKVNVFYWIDGKFGYALSAGADKGELTRIAQAVYEQLDTRPQ